MLHQYEEHRASKPRTSRHLEGNGLPGESEQDAFLDRMNGLLDAIVRECAAVGRSEDANAVLEKAASAFEGVQRMCQDAGIVHTDAADDCATPPKMLSCHAASRVAPLRSNEVSNARGHHSPVTESASQVSRGMNLELTEPLDHSRLTEEGSLPPPTPLRYRLPLSSGEDIIEVEITDILTSTQEEIRKCKHEFRLQMMEQESRQHDQCRVHMEQIQGLNEAMQDSQRHITKLQRTVHETTEKLEAMQALSAKSQKAMELTLKEHTQYWKAICHDLVVEKRTLATKLAEERGKYHSLREHIDMHEMNSKSTGETRRGSPPPAGSPTTNTKTQRSSSPSYYPPKATAIPPSYRQSRASSSAVFTSINTEDAPSSERASFRRYYLAKTQPTPSS